jgi:uncharacterized membrane protein YidH (DUF202 family)
VAHRARDVRRRYRSRQADPGAVAGGELALRGVGTAFGLSGIALIAYGYVRQREVEAAIARGGYAPFDTRAGLVFTLLGVILGFATILVILIESG